MLSHLDAQNRPLLVDVSAKAITERSALALAVVLLPPPLAQLLEGQEISSKKGPVFQTAILAGIMGAKKTSELIPLCHPLPLDDCRVRIEAQPPAADGSVAVHIYCRARTHAKTGVEMEALTGATVAALTLYDMGKGVSPDISIQNVRLLEKTGGKRDLHTPLPPDSTPAPEA